MKAIVLGGAAASLLTVSAFAADLGIPQAAPGPVIPAFTWTGCYGGLQAGGGWGEKDLTDTAQALSPISGFSSANLNISGYMLGGQIGCDYHALLRLAGGDGTGRGSRRSKLHVVPRRIGQRLSARSGAGGATTTICRKAARLFPCAHAR